MQEPGGGSRMSGGPQTGWPDGSISVQGRSTWLLCARSLPSTGGAAAHRSGPRTEVTPILREPRGAGRCQERRDEHRSFFAKNEQKADSRSCGPRRLAGQKFFSLVNPRTRRDKQMALGGGRLDPGRPPIPEEAYLPSGEERRKSGVWPDSGQRSPGGSCGRA